MYCGNLRMLLCTKTFRMQQILSFLFQNQEKFSDFQESSDLDIGSLQDLGQNVAGSRKSHFLDF